MGIENVRAAQIFVGDSVNHLGPFHLWGNAVPACFPEELYSVKKGYRMGYERAADGKVWRELAGNRRFSSKSKARANWTAEVSMVPYEVSKFIGEVTLRELVRLRTSGPSRNGAAQADKGGVERHREAE